MNLIAKTYINTTFDINILLNYGFRFQGETEEAPHDFINRCFTNFDIASYSTTIHINLRNTTELQISKLISINQNTDELWYTYGSNIDDLWFKRHFYWNSAKEIEVFHEYFKLPEKFQGQGIIKPIFQNSLQQYVNMNLKRILLEAGLSKGGYVWATYGFVAVNRFEIDVILEKAEKRLDSQVYEDVKYIYDFYYDKEPQGKEFPIFLWSRLPGMKEVLYGAEWDGALNFSDSTQFTRFKKRIYGE